MEPSAIERAGMLVSYSRALSLVAADNGAAPAIIDGETSLSFTELDRRSNQLARAYAELGVGQDDFVTLALPNCIEFFVACFAIWKLGATPQPVSHRLPFRERDEIVTLADSKLVIGVPAETHRNRTCIPQGFNPDPDIDDGLLEDRVAASWKAPTSGGSTGRPKLIVSSKPSLAPIARTSAGWAIQGQFHTWGGGNDHGCHILAGPLYHNAPFISALMGILAGCQQVLMQPNSFYQRNPRLYPKSANRVVLRHTKPTALVHRLQYHCSYLLISVLRQHRKYLQPHCRTIDGH